MLRSKALLLAGALAGLALALGSALLERSPERYLGRDVAARVNDAAISADEYARAIEALAGDKRNPITDQVRADVLERLIEEELLVQRGTEIGLMDSDRTVRKSIVNAMIAYVVADRSGHQPTDDELNAFFEENKVYFAKTERLRVKRLFVKKPDSDARPERLGEISARLAAGDPFDDVAAELSDPILPQVPDTLLPAAKLRDYLGPTLTDAAVTMEAGSVSRAIETSSGYHFLWVADVLKGAMPALDAVRDQVVSEYKRRSDDQALRDYLTWLKSEAEIIRLPQDETP